MSVRILFMCEQYFTIKLKPKESADMNKPSLFEKDLIVMLFNLRWTLFVSVGID